MTAKSILGMNRTTGEQDLEPVKFSQKEECDIMCDIIAAMLPREDYDKWVDDGPENNSEFYKYAESKLKELTPEITRRAAFVAHSIRANTDPAHIAIVDPRTEAQKEMDEMAQDWEDQKAGLLAG